MKVNESLRDFLKFKKEGDEDVSLCLRCSVVLYQSEANTFEFGKNKKLMNHQQNYNFKGKQTIQMLIRGDIGSFKKLVTYEKVPIE